MRTISRFSRLAVLLGGLLLASSASANTVTVMNTNDSGPGSLRLAITNSQANGTIVFTPGLSGTIILTSGELPIAGELTILGPGPASLTVSGNYSSRVFNIGSNATVTIAGLTIAAGLAQGPAGTGTNLVGADGEGGGILNSGTLTLTNCIVTGNSAVGSAPYNTNGIGGFGDGGGIFSSGPLNLINCQIVNNNATGGYNAGGSGGGISATGPTTLSGCTLNGNTAEGQGNEGASAGGIFIANGLLFNCTIANNLASNVTAEGNFGEGDATGGGIYYDGSEIFNDPSGDGGNPLLSPGYNGPGVIVLSCTISGNTVAGNGDTEGGGVCNYSGGELFGSGYYIVVANTIISGNQIQTDNPGFAYGPDFYGAAWSMGYNLVGNDYPENWAGVGDQVGDAEDPIDARLGPLANNGGPTPTMALLSGSPAIDQGNSSLFESGGAYAVPNITTITSDQRGQARPFACPNIQQIPQGGDRTDIGAYEFHPPQPILAAKIQLPLLEITWNEGVPAGTGPNFGVEVAHTPLSVVSVYTPVTNPVKQRYDGTFLLTDYIASNLPVAHYRANTGVRNLVIIPKTLPATAIASTSATLNGAYTPYWNNTTYWFEYGLSTNYTNFTATNSLTTTTDPTAALRLSNSVSGLAPSTLYHFHLVVNDVDGLQFGGDQSFTTAGTASPPAATTTSGTPVTSVSEQLHGIVNPNGANATYWFEYGLDTNYSLGNTTPAVVIWTNNPLPLLNNAPVSSLAGGLAAFTTYHFQLVASNSAGVTLGGDQTFTRTAPPAPPAAVTQAASGITSVNAQLNGTVNPDGADTTWWFEYGYDTNYSIANTASAVVSASNTNPVPVNILAGGLNASTLYHFQLVTSNSAGVSLGGDQSFTTLGVSPTLVTLAATSITSNSAVLNGTIDANGSQGLGRFQYGTDTNYTGGQVGNYFTSFNNDTEAYSFTLTGLSPGTTYHYQAFGYNCCAEGFGADTSFTTAGVAGPPPSAPTLVSPGTNSPVGPYVTTLTPTFTWNTNGSASYGLYLAEYPSGGATQSFTGLTGGSSAPATLQPGTNYYWYMTGFDSLGNQSSGSASLYFQTPAAPIAITEGVTNIGPSTATFSGSVNPNGLPTSVQFQYGLASGTNYNLVVPTNPTNVGTATQINTQNVTGLFVGTSYHFRFVAVNSLGTTYGAPIQFMTSAE